MKGGADSKGAAETAPKGGAAQGGQTGQRTDQKGDQNNQRSQGAQGDRNQTDQKGAQDQRGNNRAQDKSDRKDSKDSAFESKSGSQSSKKSGASIPAEKRTQITTSIRQTNVRPVTNVNFNISVGTAIPRTVTLNPLPPAVIEVYPDWRGYRFILVGNDILVIDPGSYEIVAILDA